MVATDRVFLTDTGGSGGPGTWNEEGIVRRADLPETAGRGFGVQTIGRGPAHWAGPLLSGSGQSFGAQISAVGETFRQWATPSTVSRKKTTAREKATSEEIQAMVPKTENP